MDTSESPAHLNIAKMGEILTYRSTIIHESRKMDDIPWTWKYQPKALAEVQGQAAPLAALKMYLSSFSPRRPKGALLYGPPGCGKTCSVHALAAELGLEVVEVNASDTRNKASLEDVLGKAIQQRSLFSQGKIVLVDEIDGLSGQNDRGGAMAIADIISKSAFPVVLTANDPWDKKFSSLRRKAALIRFNTPDYRSIAAVLSRIAGQENIGGGPALIERLSRRAGGDVRAAICDLQLLTAGTNRLTAEALDSLDSRNQQESLPSALTRVFKSTDPKIAWQAFDAVTEDLDECLLWLDENLPAEYEKPLDLYRGYDALSKADVHKGRIIRRQYWRFLVYIRALLTLGVALGKDKKYHTLVKYQRPARLLEIWKAKRFNALRDALSQRIAEHTHTSTRVARLDALPYVRAMFGRENPLADAIADSLEMSEEELAWLRKI